MVSQLSHVGLKPFRHPQCGLPIYFLGNCCFGEIQSNLELEGDPQPPSTASAQRWGQQEWGQATATTLP